MKSFLVAVLFAILATTATASCLYSTVPNAGIPGHNQETLNAGSAAACMEACDRKGWCKSVDYQRSDGICYLQPVGRHDTDLKRDYDGHPYDHFSCETRTGGAPKRKSTSSDCRFVEVLNAGIPGHNQEVINVDTAQACMSECSARTWCHSVDYARADGTCYLQPVGMNEAELNRAYDGDPYDHYTCEGR